MPTCRLLIDKPADGAWNMAVDEVLLARAAEHGDWTLRLYQWREATVSLGYFQRVAERDGHVPSRPCPLVRRASGGGAIVHDREITYSLAAPAGRSPDAGRRLYRQVHAAVVDVLARLGACAKLCDAAPQHGDEPFLCFQRHTAGDVLLGDAKIAGSAQRRRHDAVLQHGSLLLGASPAAPELPGVESLTGLELPVAEWTSLLSRAVAEALQLRAAPGVLSVVERQEAARIAQEKYGQFGWNRRK
ncbi:MAG TPA: biotin/lipoate A/B protein ligase family protein [Pirellulales bacterium]|nr:biotin/lipoate A/B protein ligase family protein [Pirellulales bacterium]